MTRWTIRRHMKRLEKSRVTDAQVHATPPPDGDPELPAPAFEFEFNPSLPLLDPPAASEPLQSPEDVRTEASDHVDDILLTLHTQTHRTTEDSDEEDPEGALEWDAVEAADTINIEPDDFRDGEDVDIEGDTDPREGVVSDWDLLAEEFIVEAEELSKLEHSLLHTP